MSRGAIQDLLHVRKTLLAIALTTGLAACETGPGPVDVAPMLDPVSVETGDAGAEPAAMRTAAPVGGPGLRLLPNPTALQGENYILVREQRGLGGGASVEQMLRAAGALPAPFEFAIPSAFRPADASGFSYAEVAPADGVTCVLALGAPGGPYGRPSTVIMRNCVNGDTAMALAPIATLGAL